MISMIKLIVSFTFFNKRYSPPMYSYCYSKKIRFLPKKRPLYVGGSWFTIVLRSDIQVLFSFQQIILNVNSKETNVNRNVKP